MDIAAFSKQAPGHLTPVPPDSPRVPAGVLAFVPDPLPPKLTLDWDTATLLSEADHAMGELAGTGRRLPNPHLMVRPFLNREAVLSSRIEGTTTTLRQLVVNEASALQQGQNGEVREVANYTRTMEYGLARLEELPLSLRFIRELHGRLMDGVRGAEQAGEFRDIQNYIGAGRGIQEARFVPPPVADLAGTLDAFERYLAEGAGLPPLVHVALIHYQFETIHPFRDGNGRIGRLLSALLMCARERYRPEALLPSPLLYLSAYFEQHRQEYYDRLLAVSTQGAWMEWIAFFLRAARDQSRDALDRTQRLLRLWEELRGRLQKARSSALPLRLVDDLFARPAISIPRAALLLDITYAAAAKNVEKLAAAKILEELPNSRPRLFIANEILHILQEDAV